MVEPCRVAHDDLRARGAAVGAGVGGLDAVAVGVRRRRDGADRPIDIYAHADKSLAK